ncbi:MAG: universal stress protein [Rhizobiales bacterium]|nr:universal stress protein [Hyphomicrobiales bacterium]
MLTAQSRKTLRAAAAPKVFEDILVYMDEGAAAQNALAYAEALVPEGNVAALTYGMMPDYPASEFGAEAWIIAQREAEQEAEQREARLREKLALNGSRAELRRANIVPGDEGRALAAQALYADAVIIGWPKANAEDQPAKAFEGALFHSGRPVILVPVDHVAKEAPQTVLVAWSTSREAARAVNDAIPLLRHAAQVRVVVVSDDRGRREASPGDDIARHLARHDVTVEVRHVPSNGELIYRVLLDEARFVGADMLVMGGYSHSRTGEWLFGGVTRDMLGQMTVPVLMSH